MRVPCVRVPRNEGESVRRTLAERDLIDREFELVATDEWVYIPVIDPAKVPDEFDVVRHEVEARDAQAMPSDLVDFETSYERLGDIVVLHEDDPKRARRLADAVMASDLPAKTVVNRASPVTGEERVREWTVLAGDGTETVHREYGCEFLVDIAEVYFSPRLATERHRVVEQVGDGERAFDMFCGVGPFVIPFARRGATCVGVDVNEAAIRYLRENLRRNDVEDRVTAIHADVREVAGEYAGWADRVVMNLPHTADEFLDAAVTIAGRECVIHYYDIQPESAPFESGEAAIRAAADGKYGVAVETRRVVRTYSPTEVNACLDVRLTRRD